MSKDYARGSDKNTLFSEAEHFPDLLVLDEAHHARASKKSKTFQRTLLRKMIEDIKGEIQHIVFASATPMRTHPDEYYYLMELLSIDRFINSKDYLQSLEILSLKKEDWKLKDASLIVNILNDTLKWCNDIPERYLTETEKEFLLNLKN